MVSRPSSRLGILAFHTPFQEKTLILLLILSICASDHVVFQDLTDLESKNIKTFEEIDARITGLSFLDEDRLIIFANPDKQIIQYRLSDQSLTILADRGPGPNEIHGALLQSFVFRDQIIYKDMSHRIKAFRPGEPHRTIIDKPWSIGPCVPVDGHAVCVNLTYSEVLSPDTTPHGLVIFEIREDGTWNRIGSLYDEDVIGVETDDMFFAMNTLLLPTGHQSSFYRYPKFLYAKIQVMDINSNELDEIAIPHPIAGNIPDNPGFRREYRLEHKSRPQPLRDLAVDKAGNLYAIIINAAGNKALSGRVVARQNREGTLTGNYRLPIPMKRLAVQPDGRALYLADEDDNLYRAELP